jgi:hypothetical protein
MRKMAGKEPNLFKKSDGAHGYNYSPASTWQKIKEFQHYLIYIKMIIAPYFLKNNRDTCI